MQPFWAERTAAEAAQGWTAQRERWSYPAVLGLNPQALEGCQRVGVPEPPQFCAARGLAPRARCFMAVLKACKMAPWLFRTL